MRLLKRFFEMAFLAVWGFNFLAAGILLCYQQNLMSGSILMLLAIVIAVAMVKLAADDV
jgi:hypothetical protein